MKGHPLTLESLRERICCMLFSCLIGLGSYGILGYTISRAATSTPESTIGFLVLLGAGIGVGVISVGMFWFAWSKDFDDEKPKKRKKK